MGKKIIYMRCLNCKQKFTPKRFLDKYCQDEICIDASKKEKSKVKPIAKLSKKKKQEMAVYLKLRADFLNKLENKICPITKEPTTDVHHKKGRVGKLFLETKYWLAVSRKGHQKIELNPEWAKENNYSLNRLSND